MKRFLGVGIVGLTLLMTNMARADFLPVFGDDYGTKWCRTGNHDQTFNVDLKCVDQNQNPNNGNCDPNNHDGNSNSCGGNTPPCPGPNCGNPGDPPPTVPLPSSASIGAVGLVAAAVGRWIRSRRTKLA